MDPQGTPGPSQPGKVIEVHYQRAYCFLSPRNLDQEGWGDSSRDEQQMSAALW